MTIFLPSLGGQFLNERITRLEGTKNEAFLSVQNRQVPRQLHDPPPPFVTTEGTIPGSYVPVNAQNWKLLLVPVSPLFNELYELQIISYGLKILKTTVFM